MCTFVLLVVLLLLVLLLMLVVFYGAVYRYEAPSVEADSEQLEVDKDVSNLLSSKFSWTPTG
jgi:Na+-transporting methylmalonyl-CoA/oxaloacetate decarboxylase gamma subunit